MMTHAGKAGAKKGGKKAMRSAGIAQAKEASEEAIKTHAVRDLPWNVRREGGRAIPCIGRVIHPL